MRVAQASTARPSKFYLKASDMNDYDNWATALARAQHWSERPLPGASGSAKQPTAGQHAAAAGAREDELDGDVSNGVAASSLASSTDADDDDGDDDVVHHIADDEVLQVLPLGPARTLSGAASVPGRGLMRVCPPRRRAVPGAERGDLGQAR